MATASNVVDSSARLEFLADGPNAEVSAPAIEAVGALVGPTLVITGVARRLDAQGKRRLIPQIVGHMRQGRVVALDEHVHVRGTEAPQYWLETEEVLAAALVSGAPLQIVHINSSYGEDAGRLLGLVRASRARGLDVTVEAYPYTAAMTHIDSPAFDDWPSWAPSRFARFEWPATGERLTRESFARRRREKGLVIIHGNDETIVRSILSDSLVIVASDGLADASGAHPRGAGSFARVLGSYVREDSVLTLMDALRRATLLPAQALELRAPAMRRRGRVQPGADADLAIFDPAAILDRATYREPRVPSAGFRHVVVNGRPVIRSGQPVPGVRPGAAIRAPRAP